ncbi:hypothetical protein JAAARDRAFT_37206 [Jaapia argillacea MUCL 33604]|uniref:FAD-binding domain-containing protein n=1 Tax=Jaapia argillacea MUCL 33604 TaxID=933084 RepID=A0A067PPQ0_9AGAM|nr:hypothetical protein JAAARDRAFT_37206 [Jaapia argillacea MUCL 33604]
MVLKLAASLPRSQLVRFGASRTVIPAGLRTILPRQASGQRRTMATETQPPAKPLAEAKLSTADIKHTTLYSGRTASYPLNISIIGCGLGGLAAAFCLARAGHKVSIFESAPAIGEVGAGIQMTPNLTRLLIRWGCGDVLKACTVTPSAIALRRWKDGELVGWTRWGDDMENEHGAPYYHIHRADLHKLLFDLAVPHINLHLSSRVDSINPSLPSPSITLSTGQVIPTDLIIGADGVKSMIREVVVGGPDRPVATGDAAYRAIVSTDDMMKDETLKHLVDEQEMTGWMGPERHIMAYCIRAKKEYNLVMVHPDDGSVESWTAEGSADKLRADFAGFEPRVEKLLKLVPSTLKWKLMDRAPLHKWVHDEGRVVLLGDACHPMLPYRAQGAAMAVEDGCILGNLFSRLSHPSQITPFLHAYERLRLPRTSATQASARLNQKIFHYPDGPEQQARDESMRKALRIARGEEKEVDDGKGSYNQWADKGKNREQFSYDADLEAERWWKEEGERTLGAGEGVTSKM